jgi:diguanylate cyclase (GGDEF)-like protein/PAS domain S-box-containing protein
MEAEEHEDQSSRDPLEATRPEPLPAPEAFLEGLPDAVVVTGPDGLIRLVNGLAEELFGYPRDELLGSPVQQLWAERARERYTRNMELYFATDHPVRFSTEVWGRRRDGTEFVGEMSWGIAQTSEGPLLLAVGRDISRSRAAEARSRAIAALAERALAGTGVGELAEEAIDILRTVLPLTGACVVLRDGSMPASYGSVREMMGIRLPIGAVGELLVAPERELDDDELDLVRSTANILATALARLRGEERMRHEAVHDALTGLANRTLLHDRLEHALGRSKRDGMQTAVLFIDLDNFKQINDTYGHAIGDIVLVEFGNRLRTAVRPGDTVARFGGDEFVVICEGIDEESAVIVAGRLQEAICQPVFGGGARHRLSASIGISLGDSDVDALIGQADTAVYRAKAAGGSHIEIHR